MNANLSYTKNSFNLYPKEINKSRNIKIFLYYIIALLLAFNALFGYYSFMLTNEINLANQQRLEDIDKISAAQPLMLLDGSIKKHKAETDKMTSLQRSITSVLVPSFEILKDLELKTPSDITLNSITISDDGKINLVGLSKDEFVVSDFVTALKQIDKFSGVHLKSVVKKEDETIKKDAYVNIFTIECTVKGAGKAAKTN